MGSEMCIRDRVKGMTQEELASAADLSPNFIRTVEQGKSGLSFNTIEPVANALGLKPKDLFDFE